jgi:hypothetical protein
MNTIFILTLVLAAAAAQKPAAKNTMLADAEARPKLALAATAKPMRLVEEPPAGPGELMLLDREKIAVPAQPAGKPSPFPAEPQPPR